MRPERAPERGQHASARGVFVGPPLHDASACPVSAVRDRRPERGRVARARVASGHGGRLGRGQRVALVGVATSHDLGLDTARLDRALAGLPHDVLTILLYHSPDLILQAAERGVDLYLGGHTHGGQIRLPLYGAVVTSSLYGRRYVSGLFREGAMTMIISRGLGFEGGAAPRARFLCRPQIVSLTLQGVGSTLRVDTTLPGE